jgi:outer membrane autotransporter protein
VETIEAKFALWTRGRGGVHDRKRRVAAGLGQASRRPRRRFQFSGAIALLVVDTFAFPLQAADLEITSSTASGVNLDSFSGTTAHIATGVVVSNTGTSIGGGFPGVFASTRAWTLGNDGTVHAILGNGVDFGAGGTINNAGTVTAASNGINFAADGTVNNLATGNVSATFSAISVFGVGTVTNAGTITGGSFADAVELFGGGMVTNQTAALISSTSQSNAVSLSGGSSRTVINDGTIRDTGIGFATGVLIQGGAGTITNGPNGRIFGTFNGIFASSDAPLTLTNRGAISSTNGPGVEADGGGSITNSGTIQSGNDGLLIGGAATVTNRGTIGSTGSGRAIVFSDGATHTLQLDTGSVLNGNVQGGSGTDNLVLLGSGMESIAKFLSFETLSMQGTDWSLNGTGTFSTSAQVQNGSLRVNGQLTSPSVGIAASGILTGNGTVVGTVTSAGTVRVDSGTLTINGNFVNNGGIYNTGVTPATNGLLAVIGAGHTAHLNGGTVQVTAAMGQYALSTNYTILSASGGVTGTFTGATSNFAFLAPSLSYDANNVFLTLKRNAIDFVGIGSTANERAAGSGVQGLGFGNSIYNAVLLLTAPQARAAFDSLSGEVHSTAQRAIIDDLHFVREAILGRLRAEPAAGTADGTLLGYAAEKRIAKQAGPIFAKALLPAPVYTTWGDAYGSRSHADSDGNAAAMTADRAGLIAGVDVALPGDRRLGMVFAGSETSLSVSDRSSSATISNLHAAVYGGARWGAVGLRGGSIVSWNDLNTHRTVAFPGFADDNSARYAGVAGQVFGEAGYRVDRVGMALEPFAGLAHIALRTDAFTETGGAAALSGLGGAEHVSSSTLGVRATKEGLIGPVPVAARASLAWRHVIGGDTPTARLAFTSGSPLFLIAGVPIAPDAAVLEGGIDVALSRAASLGIAYRGQLASGADEHALEGLWRFRF